MARIEDSFLINTDAGTKCPSVSEIGTSGGAVSSPKGASFRTFHPTRPEPPPLDDESREEAIRRAGHLVEYLHAMARLHEALWWRDDCFTHKAAYDLALSDAHAARGIMERLIKGRSPAMVAKLERERGLHLPACANEERAV